MSGRTGRISLPILQRILESLFSEANQVLDAIDQYCKIENLMETVKNAKIIIGDDNDFHNVAVVLARNESFDYACDVLDIGLNINPNSVDLLADYLNYGRKCCRNEKCMDLYEKLLNIKTEWNWRAYQFLIEFLLALPNEKNKNEVISKLINEFIDHFPSCEEAYLTKAQWLKNTTESERKMNWNGESFESVLLEATGGKYIVKRTPKCDLQLADYYYSLGGKAEETYNLLKKCINDFREIQPAVNRAYVYLLASLCGMDIYYNTAVRNEGNNEEEIPPLLPIISEVYRNYHYSFVEDDNVVARGSKTLIEMFVRETKVPYPYDDGVNNDIPWS